MNESLHDRQAFRLDPELAAMAVMMPRFDITDIPGARATERALVREMRRAPRAGGRAAVQVDELSCPRADGTPLGLRRYAPEARRGRDQLSPCLLFIHGGSFVTGGLHSEDDRCEMYASRSECVVIAVDYRLAPEHRFPAALDDCWLALEWVAGGAADLGIDTQRLAVGGLSAGGALAASVAAMALDRNGPELRLQMLLFPALDVAAQRTANARFAEAPVLDAATASAMWPLYLGSGAAGNKLPRYASPADRPRLRGLPPAYICVAEVDPLRDEAMRYGQRLLADEVPLDLRLWSRTFHSFDSFAATKIGQLALTDQVEALAAAFR